MPRRRIVLVYVHCVYDRHGVREGGLVSPEQHAIEEQADRLGAGVLAGRYADEIRELDEMPVADRGADWHRARAQLVASLVYHRGVARD